eukprot:1923060-Pyramimonas_sp.AAC.2
MHVVDVLGAAVRLCRWIVAGLPHGGRGCMARLRTPCRKRLNGQYYSVRVERQPHAGGIPVIGIARGRSADTGTESPGPYNPPSHRRQGCGQ